MFSGAALCPLIWILIQVDAQLRPSFRKIERSDKIEELNLTKSTKFDATVEKWNKLFRSLNRNAFIQIPIYHTSFVQCGYMADDLFNNKKLQSRMSG
jgi:hypothetical protein